MRKFKIGDVIRLCTKDSSEYNRYVIDIVFKKRMVDVLDFTVENCYILNRDNGFISYMNFSEEHLYEIIYANEYKSIINSSCPKCNGELKDHYSDWAGKDIKKCKACGWC